MTVGENIGTPAKTWDVFVKVMIEADLSQLILPVQAIGGEMDHSLVTMFIVLTWIVKWGEYGQFWMAAWRYL